MTRSGEVSLGTSPRGYFYPAAPRVSVTMQIGQRHSQRCDYIWVMRVPLEHEMPFQAEDGAVEQ